MPPPLDPRLKLRHFSLVVAIEETGSLRKAADSLHITQAAASSLLAELEYLLGAPLFSRSRSGTRATASGKLLVDRARPILANLHAAAEEIRQAGDDVTGEIHIGTLQAAAQTILPLAITQMHRDKSNVRFHVIDGPARQHVDSLLRGNLDFVIGRVPPAQVSGLLQKMEILVSEPYEVVCRIGHPLARRTGLQISDVAEMPWILPETGSPLSDDFYEAFLNASVQPPKPVVVTSSALLRFTLVESSDMLTVLTRRIARVQEARGVLAILDVGMTFRDAPTLLLTREDAILSPAATAFIQYVSEAARIIKSGS